MREFWASDGSEKIKYEDTFKKINNLYKSHPKLFEIGQELGNIFYKLPSAKEEYVKRLLS